MLDIEPMLPRWNVTRAMHGGSCIISEHGEAADAPAEPAANGCAAGVEPAPGAGDAAQTPGASGAPAAEPPAAAGDSGAAPPGDAADPGPPHLGMPSPIPEEGAPRLPPRGAPSGAEGSGRGLTVAARGGMPFGHLAQLSMASSGMGDDEVDPEYVCAICLARPLHKIENPSTGNDAISCVSKGESAAQATVPCM